MPESAADERSGSSGRIRTEEQPPRQTTRTHSILTASQLSTEFSSGCLGPVWTRKGTVEGSQGLDQQRLGSLITEAVSEKIGIGRPWKAIALPFDTDVHQRDARRITRHRTNGLDGGTGRCSRGAVPGAASRRQAAATRTIASRARRTGKMVADRADASITGCVHAEASARAPFCGEGLRSS